MALRNRTKIYNFSFAFIGLAMFSKLLSRLKKG